jgi:putative PEP-CTERM system histidine kinase
MDYLLQIIAAVVSFGLAATVWYGEPKRSYARHSLAIGLVLFGVESVFCAVSSYILLSPEVLLWQRLRLLIMALVPGCWLLFSLTYARGNDREFVLRWKGALLAAFVIPVGIVGLTWRELFSGSGEVGPESMWLLPLGRPGVILNIVFIGGCVLCLMNLERTLRSSTGTMRWRIKYMIVGLATLFTVRCYSASQSILYSAVNLDLSVLNASALILGSALIYLSVSRGSLNAVDLYPSHGVLYGSLTVIMTGTYLLLVGVFAEAAVFLGVGESFPLQTFMILLSLVGVAAILLSDRMRQRTRRFVSHHFQRPQYDYRRVWSLFSERTASVTDPQEFCRAVTRVIADTLETLSVTVWLVGEDGSRLTYGGSTSLSAGEAAKLIGLTRLGEDAARLLRDSTYPTAVRDVQGDLGVLLRQLGHKEFENGGEYFCLSLATRDEVLGLLVLGDRVGGLPFTIEEIELLKTIGNQLTANLLSIKLSHRLADAKKLEAFQTMSAFFVHDLKNTASTLSLMLQNLPKHFDDPAFRQDALKAISRSVEKINGLIARLTFFRQKMDIKPVEADIVEVVKNTLAGLGSLRSENLTMELNPVSKVMVDAEQMQKVITNLVLNAREACGPEGRIQIRTSQKDGWVCLAVSDNGCGMSAEFVEQSLFKPFQTTKPEGIGIGLFHSRMIIEAHRGRIEVESREGEGSTFRISLPAREGRT